MKNSIRTIFAAFVFILALASCQQETNDFNDRLTDLEDRVSKLEKLCAEMNTNISSLQGIVSALQNQDYITTVNELTSDGQVIGYTINFAKGQPITIYHGKDGVNGKDGADGKDGTNGKDGQNGKDGADGKDGSTPGIGVKQDTDGIWYWTLNGEWLLDDNGQKIKAVGTDGKDGQNGKDGQDGKDGQNGQDGKDGITPQLNIEGGYWYVSTDNGQTWTQLGKATGENGKDGVDGKDGKDGVDGVDGDSMFQSVTVTETEVTFVTSDGQTFVVKRAAALSIEFDSADLVVMGTNATRNIHYTITSGVDNVTIEALSSADIKVKVVKTDTKTGTLQVKTGATIDEYSKVVVLVSNGSQAIMRTLNFEAEAIEVEENTTKEVSDEGGEVTLDFFSNTPCHAIIPVEVQSWISVVPETKAMDRQTIGLIVQPNKGESRKATVLVQSETGSLVLPFIIEQQQKPLSKALLPKDFLPNEIDKSTITEAYFYASNPTTTETVISSGGEGYEPIYFKRVGTAAHFYTVGQVYKPETCNELFNGWESLHSLDLSMFDTSEVTDFDSMFKNCLNLQSLNISSLNTSRAIFFSSMFLNCEKLLELDVTNFDTLCAEYMNGMFCGCHSLRRLDLSSFNTSSCVILDSIFGNCYKLEQIDGISNWDLSACTSLCGMFSGCWSLKQLNVSSWDTSHCIYFNHMFAGCRSLESIDVSSFDTSHCIYFNHMFAGCQSLESIDVSSFDTSNAINLSYMFHHCTKLKTIAVSSWKTDKVQNTSGMFASCFLLSDVDLSKWDLRELISADNMFESCSSLKSVSLPNVQTPKLQSIKYMFMLCRNLTDLSFNGLSTSNVTSMEGLFFHCPSLSSLDLSSFDTSNVSSMHLMFDWCSGLTELDLSSFDTQNVSDMSCMFTNCYSLKYLDVSNFNTAHLESADSMFDGLVNMTKLDLGAFSLSSELSLESIFGLDSWFFKLGERVSQCHIRCLAETKNTIISFNESMGSDTKYVWYSLQKSLPEIVNDRDPNLYYSTNYSMDKRVIVKQAATEGNGLDIVIMGDGFSDRLIADGTYDTAMNAVVDAIFSEEPYKSFKHLFNVYVVYAVSENEVIGKNTSFSTYDTRNVFTGAIGSLDEEKIRGFARLASRKSDAREIVPIVVINSSINDGAVTSAIPCSEDYLRDPEWDDYHGGENIVYISGPFTPLVAYSSIHEMGHAFGQLADEYVYNGWEDYNDSEYEKSTWPMLCIYGMYKNIDFTGDPNSVKWKHFLNDARYSNEDIGCFEGAFFNNGVWRPTENSIMRNDANGHYNAPSREAIYYRIHKLAYGKDWQYNYEDFVQWDIKNIPSAVSPAPKYAPRVARPNQKHIFKMEKSIAPDGRQLITIIQN